MASGDGIFPDEATIWIVDNGTDPSTGLGTSEQFQAYITSFSESGGEEARESVPVFGGGNVTKKKSRSRIQVAFDVIPKYGTDATKFDEFALGSTLSSDGEAPAKDIYIQFSDGTNYYTRAYRECYAVSFNPSADADDIVKGSITFELDPTNDSGAANKKVATTQASSITWS